MKSNQKSSQKKGSTRRAAKTSGAAEVPASIPASAGLFLTAPRSFKTKRFLKTSPSGGFVGGGATAEQLMGEIRQHMKARAAGKGIQIVAKCRAMRERSIGQQSCGAD